MFPVIAFICTTIVINCFSPIAAQTTTKPPTVVVQPNTQWCLGCICQAISNCNVSQTSCDGDVCGVFRITWGYWADGGKQVVPNDDPKLATAYSNCTMDTKCAGSTVTAYLTRYSQDCNGNGVVDCEDYGAIHKFGGYGCTQPFAGEYFEKLRTCIHHVQSPKETTVKPQSGQLT